MITGHIADFASEANAMIEIAEMEKGRKLPARIKDALQDEIAERLFRAWDNCMDIIEIEMEGQSE